MPITEAQAKPGTKFTLPGEPDNFDTLTIKEEAALPAVTFEVAILDKPEPVKITAALIREKSKDLTDLVIANMFDDKGYEAVKKALSSKAVKTRTVIEKKEKEVLKDMKTRHAAEIKEVTDYTAELYIVCREVEKNLQDKLNKVDNEKKAAADKLSAQEKERTQGRENKMFELGLLFNGQAFVGLGRQYTKNALHSLSDESYSLLIAELEALQLEQSVTGEVKPAPSPLPIAGGGSVFSTSVRSGGFSPPDGKSAVVYGNAIYDKKLHDGTRIVLTNGIVENPEAGAIVVNDRVKMSGVYVQVI